ncbi:MAG: thiamine biosynthesis protein ThiS [Deltaproteobacteria bacterium GWA2_55_10]|nr:MAG: thiamine biosynthesis protein ThiS [Deltaproteobacteria bacterium GWA2_55_10]
MKIKLNGEIKEVEDGITIQSLLDSLSIKIQGIAVDLNREIVPKRLFGSTSLKDGDEVEIVRMVGGG